MAELVIKIPEHVKLDIPELSRDVEKFIKLRMSRDLLIKALDELLKGSKLTDEECIKFGRMIKKGRFEKLKRAGLV